MAAPGQGCLNDHVAHPGGPDVTTVAERSICRRIAVMETELEMIEERMANGQRLESQLHLYQRTSNTLRRLLADIGLKCGHEPELPDDDDLMTK